MGRWNETFFRCCLATLSRTIRMAWMATYLSNINHIWHEHVSLFSYCSSETFALAAGYIHRTHANSMFAAACAYIDGLQMYTDADCVECVFIIVVSVPKDVIHVLVFNSEQVLFRRVRGTCTCVPFPKFMSMRHANTHTSKRFRNDDDCVNDFFAGDNMTFVMKMILKLFRTAYVTFFLSQ